MEKKFKVEIPTIDEIYGYLADLAVKIKSSKEKYDLILGVARGGLIPARILGDFLLIKDIRILYARYYSKPYETFEKPKIYSESVGDVTDKKILIVDDVADTGDTLIEIKKYLESKHAKKVDIAVIYKKPWNKAKIKYFSKETDAWIVFPWEFLETAIDLLNSENKDEFIKELEKKPILKKMLENLLDDDL
jgi:hypothetical protein